MTLGATLPQGDSVHNPGSYIPCQEAAISLGVGKVLGDTVARKMFQSAETGRSAEAWPGSLLLLQASHKRFLPAQTRVEREQ